MICTCLLDYKNIQYIKHRKKIGILRIDNKQSRHPWLFNEFHHCTRATLMDPDRVDSLVLMHQTAMAKKRFLQVQRLSKPLPIVPMKRE